MLITLAHLYCIRNPSAHFPASLTLSSPNTLLAAMNLHHVSIHSPNRHREAEYV